MAFHSLRCKDLTVQVGDNGRIGLHRAGYHGIYALVHRHLDISLFVPAYSGMNLEHIFDGRVLPEEVLYEPREAEMMLEVRSKQEAVLYQPPTPFFGLESWTTFRVQDPDRIEWEFSCVPTRPTFQRGYIGLFWASYIQAPENKSLYFWGRFPRSQASHWIQWCTQAHALASTVTYLHESFQPTFDPHHPRMLFTQLSPLKFEHPFFYGRFHSHVWAIFFDRADGIRFSHSPSGGGPTHDGTDTYPAWDFQWIIPNYQVGRRYTLRARIIYREWKGREDLWAEWEQWQEESQEWRSSF